MDKESSYLARVAIVILGVIAAASFGLFMTTQVRAQTQAPSEAEVQSQAPQVSLAPAALPAGKVVAWVLVGCGPNDHDLIIVFDSGKAVHYTAQNSPSLDVLKKALGDVPGFVRRFNCAEQQ